MIVPHIILSLDFKSQMHSRASLPKLRLQVVRCSAVVAMLYTQLERCYYQADRIRVGYSL